MYTFHYNLQECLQEYLHLINRYNIFPFIVVSILVLGILIIINRDNRKADIIFTIINLILIIMLIFIYGKDTITNLDTFVKGNISHNMYFYFFNTFISIILCDRFLTTSRTDNSIKISITIWYVLLIINWLFTLYIAHSISFHSILIIGNIYPMVLIGNIISILLYIFIIIYCIVNILYKYYNHKKHLLS